MMRKVTVALCLIPTLALSLTLPHEEAVPGGIKIIRLEVSDPRLPYVESEGRRVMVVNDGKSWFAIVGIPLSAKIGKRRVSLRGEAAPQSLEFQVHKKKRLRQSLKVAPRQVNLSAADAARVKSEKADIDQALNRWTVEPPESLRLPQPVPGVRSGSFGLRRVFNGQSRSPHSGMDIAAPVGTQILAPAAGQVIETGDYFFTGNTVFVDHGRGLISMYCHLSKVSVKPGERISAGTSLGEVGMTGRATGPHLHWAISLNRAWIDPALFLP